MDVAGLLLSTSLVVALVVKKKAIVVAGTVAGVLPS
jgi:hypothetical protein